MDLGCQVWKRVWKVIFLLWNRVKIWRSGRHTPIKNSQEYSPGYPYQRELKEDNGTAPGLHNTRFMSQARQTRHFARNECVRLSWLLERLLCRPVCTMIRSPCGSCLMTGENSLENTFRPPSISPQETWLGGQFSSLTVQVYTNLSTHSLQKSTLLSFEQSLQCHLVPGMGLTPQPSHWKSKISIVI